MLLKYFVTQLALIARLKERISSIFAPTFSYSFIMADGLILSPSSSYRNINRSALTSFSVFRQVRKGVKMGTSKAHANGRNIDG